MTGTFEEIDPSVLGELIDLMGPVKVAGMIIRLKEILSQRDLLDDSKGAPQLATEFHKLTSQTGMLGFLNASETFRSYERKALEGAIVSSDLDIVRASIERLKLEASKLSELLG